MIDLSKLNQLGGGAPQSEATQPKVSKPHVTVKQQQELDRERDRFLKEQRERVANTSTLKLEIIKAIKNNEPQDQVMQMLIECVSIATSDKAFKDMCQKS